MSMTRSIARSLLSLVVTSALLGLLAGCGGGAGGGGGTSGGTSGTSTSSSSTSTTSTTSAAAATSSSAPGATITPTAIELLVSSPTIPSSGDTTVDVTAIVLNAAGVISGKPLELTVTDSAAGSDPTKPAFLTSVSAAGLSDANGKVTAKLNVGTNKANRTLTVGVRSLNAAGSQDCCSPAVSTTVNVTGTTVGVTGSTSVVLGGTTPLTVTVKDSAGNAIVGAPVTISPSRAVDTLTNPGPPVTACPAASSCGTTNSIGQLVVTFAGSAAVAGADTITATAMGVSGTLAVTVSGTNFLFIGPTSPVGPVAALVARADALEIPVGAVPPAAASAAVCPPAASANLCVTTHFDLSLVNQSPFAAPVTFTATRGVFSNSSSTITNSTADINGNATVTIGSTTAGPSTITASSTGGGGVAVSKTINVVFVATTVGRVDVQANPTAVSANLVGTSTNTTTITAAVRDTSNNLVKNARVIFSITSDPTGGSLSAPSAVTDSSGVASTTYIAGSTTCCGPGTSNVTISATVTGITIAGVFTPVAAVACPAIPCSSNSVNLTVGGRPLFVRLGADNTIGSSGLTYQKKYVALVTDAAGNPVPAATVQFTVRPRQNTGAGGGPAYFKGVRIFCAKTNPPTVPPAANPTLCGSTVAVASWSQISTISCITEDTNFNGILDLGPPASPANEDTNNDGVLTPGNIASVNSIAATDNNGFATATISYAKEFASWAAVTLVATASVSGTEATSTATFALPVLSVDVSEPSVLPPGFVSPFGRGGPILERPDLAILSATFASPIVITTSALHGFVAGQQVTISGITGNTAANDTWTIGAAVLTGTTFSLNGSTGNGAFVLASGAPVCTGALPFSTR